MTTAPSQHACSVAAIERFIAQMEPSRTCGVEPSVLRRVRGLFQARKANAASRNLTPLEGGRAGHVDLITTEHIRILLLRQRITRGGDERRRGLAEEAETELRAADDGVGGEASHNWSSSMFSAQLRGSREL